MSSILGLFKKSPICASLRTFQRRAISHGIRSGSHSREELEPSIPCQTYTSRIIFKKSFDMNNENFQLAMILPTPDSMNTLLYLNPNWEIEYLLWVISLSLGKQYKVLSVNLEPNLNGRNTRPKAIKTIGDILPQADLWNMAFYLETRKLPVSKEKLVISLNINQPVKELKETHNELKKFNAQYDKYSVALAKISFLKMSRWYIVKTTIGLALVIQFLLLAYASYFIGWDIVEPVTYMCINLEIGIWYLVYLLCRRSPYMDYGNYLQRKIIRKFIKNYGIDVKQARGIYNKRKTAVQKLRCWRKVLGLKFY